MAFDIITAVIAVGALALAIIVFFKERRDTQLRLFTDFSNVATNIFAQKKDFEKDEKLFEWAIVMLNHLEHFAYLINQRSCPKSTPNYTNHI